MSTPAPFPKIAAVQPLDGKRLLVDFRNGVSKVYDCTPLLKRPPFEPLSHEPLFRMVHADPHGYAVIWNDAIDLAESELWLRGQLVRT